MHPTSSNLDWIAAVCCPGCRRAGSLACSGSESGQTIRCRSCDASLPVVDGIPDFTPHLPRGSTRSNASLSQRLMETRAFAAIYETPIWRPLLVRLGAGITIRREIDEVVAFASDRQIEAALDLGCGTGPYARTMAARCPDAEIWAADRSQAMLREAVRLAAKARVDRVHCYRSDLHALPHADASLDWVNCSGTLHLLPDLRPAWREIVRVLRPGGILTGMIVVMTTGPLRHLQRRAHERGRATFLDRESLRHSLEAFGLSQFESKVYGGAMLFRCERVATREEATSHG